MSRSKLLSASILETKRLCLREMVAEDADALGLVLSDAETMRYYPAAFDRVQVAQWIERNRGRYSEQGSGLYAAVLKRTGQVIGDCGLTWQQVDGARELEVGYHIRRDLWNQGLATEVARACVGYGFSYFLRERIIALIRPENLPSCRVAEKLGMRIDRLTVWANLPHYVYAISPHQSIRSAQH